MRVIKYKSIWLFLGVAALLCSCSAGERPFQEENLEIRNLIATIDGGPVTRAVAELGVSVGRTGFKADRVHHHQAYIKPFEPVHLRRYQVLLL